MQTYSTSVMWMVFLFHIQKMPDSNLFLRLAILTTSFGFPQHFHANTCNIPHINPQPLPSISVPIN